MGSFENIEIGAGSSEFGRKFYSRCVETDINFWQASDDHIDIITHAQDVSVKCDQFDHVVICNPYEYGFIREPGVILLREILRILKSNGKIILVTSSRNRYCQPSRIQDAVNTVCSESGVSIAMEVKNISCRLKYPGQKFYRLDGTETMPNLEITLHVKK